MDSCCLKRYPAHQGICRTSNKILVKTLTVATVTQDNLLLTLSLQPLTMQTPQICGHYSSNWVTKSRPLQTGYKLSPWEISCDEIFNVYILHTTTPPRQSNTQQPDMWCYYHHILAVRLITVKLPVPLPILIFRRKVRLAPVDRVTYSMS